LGTSTRPLGARSDSARDERGASAVEVANAAAPFTDVVPRMVQIYTQYLTSNQNAEVTLKRLFNPRAKWQEIEDAASD
jgi:hypothetical protein